MLEWDAVGLLVAVVHELAVKTCVRDTTPLIVNNEEDVSTPL